MGFAQKLDEDIPSYFTREEELYKQAQPVDQPQTSPETDEQFVFWLVNGLRDRRLIEHIWCRLDQDHPLTVTKLRAAVNAELSIQSLSPSSPHSDMLVGSFDWMKSLQKMTPPCLRAKRIRDKEVIAGVGNVTEVNRGAAVAMAASRISMTRKKGK